MFNLRLSHDDAINFVVLGSFKRKLPFVVDPSKIGILHWNLACFDAVIQDGLDCLDDLAYGGVGVIQRPIAILMFHLIDKTLVDVLDLQAT